MRWTNYFLHPGDNRYYVFTFEKVELADRYESDLKGAEIPYERHEMKFGVPRTHFREALNLNHLIAAETREPFIPHAGLKWAMLIITAAVLLLAVTGALTSKVHAQQMESKYGWEMAIQMRANIPFEIAGVEPFTYSEAGLTSTWTPLLSQTMGVRINHRLRESWTFGTGITWMRNNYSIQMHYQNDTLGLNTTDTIPLLRAMVYRIPLVAETRVPLGEGFFITAAAGVGIEFSPSNFFAYGSTQNGSQVRDYEGFLGRYRWGSLPMLAEFGFEKQPKGDDAGYYFGVFWSRSILDDYWVENVWQNDMALVKTRDAFSSTTAGVEVRILLK
jgi:hypothetical protein